MAGWQFNNPIEKLVEKAQSGASSSDSSQGQRLSLFTGQAVPAFRLNIAAQQDIMPPNPSAPAQQASPTESPTLEARPEPSQGMPHSIAEPEYANPDVSGLYPETDNAGLLDLGGGITDASAQGATVQEPFFVAPTSEPSHEASDEFSSAFHSDNSEEPLLTLGHPIESTPEEYAFDSMEADAFNLSDDTSSAMSGVPMVDLSTGDVVEPIESVPAHAPEETNSFETSTPEFPTEASTEFSYVDDTDAPFDITHDDHSTSFEEASAESDAFDDTFSDTAFNPKFEANTASVGDETDLSEGFTEGFDTAVGPEARDADDAFWAKPYTETADSAPIDDSVWGMDTDTSAQNDSENSSAPYITDFGDFDEFGSNSAPTETFNVEQPAKTFDNTEALVLEDTPHATPESVSYLDAHENVPLTSEDVAEFYPQHHELSEHGEPASSVTLPPESGTDSAFPASPTLTTLAEESFFGSHQAPLDDLDMFSEDDDSWSLDASLNDNSHEETSPFTSNTEDLDTQADSHTNASETLMLTPETEPAEATPPDVMPQAEDWMSVLDDGDDTFTGDDWSLDSTEPDGFSTSATDNTDALNELFPDTMAYSPELAASPQSDSFSAPEPNISGSESETTSQPELAPAAHPEFTGQPATDITTDDATGSITTDTAPEVLHQHPIHMQLSLRLTANAEHPQHIDLWAENPTTGDQLLLKSLPQNLLPTPLSRMAVTTEARLKDKTIYRVDLVRWKGLFSQDVHGTLAFRDELVTARSNP